MNLQDLINFFNANPGFSLFMFFAQLALITSIFRESGENETKSEKEMATKKENDLLYWIERETPKNIAEIDEDAIIRLARQHDQYASIYKENRPILSTTDKETLKHHDKQIGFLIGQIFYRKNYTKLFELSKYQDYFFKQKVINHLNRLNDNDLLQAYKDHKKVILEKMDFSDWIDNKHRKIFIEQGYNIYQNKDSCLKHFAYCENLEMVDYLLNNQKMLVSDQTINYLKENGYTKALQIYFDRETQRMQQPNIINIQTREPSDV